MAKVLIVGAGFAGAVMAERLVSAGHTCVVIDKRSHIGGNAYDRYNEHGLLVHEYGPHIFHTNSERVFSYLSRFTDWRDYEHRVLCNVAGRLYPFPINRRTLEMVYGSVLSENEARALLEKIREPKNPVSNSEDLVLNSVGRRLYEMFFEGYTTKQWGRPPSSLSAGVAARIPVRTNYDDRYFADSFQAMPAAGYTKMFEKLLDNPNIEILLENDYFEMPPLKGIDHTIYSGPIDLFFGARLGKLPYRSIEFQHEFIPNVRNIQEVGTINYPNEMLYTRITEFKHLTGQEAPGTAIVKEYPRDSGDPYYPIPSIENELLFKKYAELASAESNVTFIGRLAQYRYYNMDQVVAAALVTSQKFGASEPLPEGIRP